MGVQHESLLSKTYLLAIVGRVGSKEMLWWIMAAVGWSLWKTRNDLIFSNIVIKSPKQVAYKSLGFLKQWIMMARKDGAMKEASLDKLKEGMERW